jgi:hypothetical protein
MGLLRYKGEGNRMNDIMFIVFSTIEALSIFTIMLAIFRFNILDYINKLFPISLLLSLLSYALWKEDVLTSYVPIISVLVLILFIFYILRTSLVGAAMVAIKGYVAYGVIQTAALAILQSFGLISLERVQASKPDLYILQTVTALILLLISLLLLRYRYGFSYSLNKFRWGGEGKLVLSLLIFGIIFVAGISLFRTTLYLAATIFATLLFFMIYLSRREEKR